MSDINRRAGLKSVITQAIASIDAKIAAEDLSQLTALQEHIEEYLHKVQACDEEILKKTEEAEYTSVLIGQSIYTLRGAAK